MERERAIDVFVWGVDGGFASEFQLGAIRAPSRAAGANPKTAMKPSRASALSMRVRRGKQRTGAKRDGSVRSSVAAAAAAASLIATLSFDQSLFRRVPPRPLARLSLMLAPRPASSRASRTWRSSCGGGWERERGVEEGEGAKKKAHLKFFFWQCESPLSRASTFFSICFPSSL